MNPARKRIFEAGKKAAAEKLIRSSCPYTDSRAVDWLAGFNSAMTPGMKHAYELGRNTQLKGGTLMECPYLTGGKQDKALKEQWMLGFQEAKR